MRGDTEMRTFEEIKKEQRAVMEKWFDEWHALGGREHKPSWDYEEVCRKLEGEWLKELKVGDHAHVNMYSDIEPCTVIKRTACTITVRYDDAKLNGTWKPHQIVGGFCAHCDNNDGQLNGGWDIFEDPDGRTEVFRWSEKYQKWLNKCGEKLRPEWMKFYDYNF
jgi:hypothetical protein